jgi:hypothetical protein
LNLRTVSDKINFSGLMAAGSNKPSPNADKSVKMDNSGNTGKEIDEQ